MSNIVWIICIILIIMLSAKINQFSLAIISKASEKYKMRRNFRSQSIKIQCIVFVFYRILHKIESAIVSVI